MNIQCEVFVPGTNGLSLLESVVKPCVVGAGTGTMETVEEEGKSRMAMYKTTCSLAQLLDEAFLDKYVRPKECSLYAFSNQCPVDHGNVCVITPRGHLIISTDADTYQKLGLSGRASTSKSQQGDRYNIEVNLRSTAFRSGSEYYERVRWVLGSRLCGIEMVVMCERNGTSIPIMVPALNTKGVREGADIAAVEMHLEESIYEDTDLIVPDINLAISNGDLQAVWDWYGALTAGLEVVKTTYTCEEYVSTYSPSLYTIEERITSGARIKWTGIVPLAVIHKIVAASDVIFEKDRSIPFISIMVWGLRDSPLSFYTSNNGDGFREHSFNGGGDNDYLIVITKSKEFVFFESHS